MAHMNQERKAKIAEALKKVVPAGWKYSLSVHHHSTIVMTISKAPVDLMQEVSYVAGDPHKQDYCQVNIYHPHHFFKKSLPTIKAIIDALNLRGDPDSNYDNSDIQTDYFDQGWYVHLNIGKWGKPFVYDEDNDASDKVKKAEAWKKQKIKMMESIAAYGKYTKAVDPFLQPLSTEESLFKADLPASANGVAGETSLSQFHEKGCQPMFGTPDDGIPHPNHKYLDMVVKDLIADDKIVQNLLFTGTSHAKFSAPGPNLQNIPKDKFSLTGKGEFKILPQEAPKYHWVKVDSIPDSPMVDEKKPAWMNALPPDYDKCHSVAWDVKPDYVTMKTMDGTEQTILKAQHCKVVLDMGNWVKYEVPVPHEFVKKMEHYTNMGNSDVVAFKLAVADAITTYEKEAPMQKVLKDIEDHMMLGTSTSIPLCLQGDINNGLFSGYDPHLKNLLGPKEKSLQDIVKESGSTHLIVVKPGEKLK